MNSIDSLFDMVATEATEPSPEEITESPRPVTGTCCACGYSEAEDVGECPKMEDGIHCNHWFDGDDSEKGGAK
jgi:hypothetical protein